MKELVNQLNKYNKLIISQKKLSKVVLCEKEQGHNKAWVFLTPNHEREISKRIESLHKSFWKKIEKPLDKKFLREINSSEYLQLKYFSKILIYLQVISLFKNFTSFYFDENTKKVKRKRVITPKDEEFESIIKMPFFFTELATAFVNYDIKKIKVMLKNNKLDYENIIKQIKRLGNLKLSNPNEQELFFLVLDEYKSTPIEYKIKPYHSFKKVNDKMKLIPPEEIIEKGFTNTPLYNRWTQFKRRQQKKSKKP